MLLFSAYHKYIFILSYDYFLAFFRLTAFVH